MTTEHSTLPPHWRLARLGEIATVVGGGTPRASNPANFAEDTGHPWITPSDLASFGDKYISRGRRFLTDQGLSSSTAKYVPEGSVLFSSRAPIGNVAIAARALTTNQGFRTLVPAGEVISDYLYYSLNALRPIAQQVASGTTFAEISGTRLAELPIALPPIEEQRAISRWLDRVMTMVDEVLTEVNETTELLNQARTAFTEAVLASALTPEEDRVGSVSSGVEEYEKSESAIPRLPALRVPIHRLGDLADATRYGIIRKAERTPFKDSLPMIRMGNIQDGQLDLKDLQYIAEDRDSRKYILKDGDLLFNRTNSPELVGKSAIFHANREMVFASYIIKVQLNMKLVHPGFVAMWINSAWGRSWAQAVKADGISQSNINAKKLVAMPVPVPELVVQRRVVDAVASARTTIASVAGQLETVGRDVMSARARALDKGVMTDALWAAAGLPAVEDETSNSEVETVSATEIPTAIGSRSTSDEADLFRLVEAAGGSCTPTDLWQSSAYANDIDAFYRELRRYIEQGTLVEARVSAEVRMIEVPQ